MQTSNLIWFLYVCVPISDRVLATEQVLSKYLLIKWIFLYSITFFFDNYWVVDTLKILTNATNPLLKNTHRKTIFYRTHGSQLSCANGNHFQGWGILLQTQLAPDFPFEVLQAFSWLFIQPITSPTLWHYFFYFLLHY